MLVEKIWKRLVAQGIAVDTAMDFDGVRTLIEVEKRQKSSW